MDWKSMSRILLHEIYNLVCCLLDFWLNKISPLQVSVQSFHERTNSASLFAVFSHIFRYPLEDVEVGLLELLDDVTYGRSFVTVWVPV